MDQSGNERKIEVRSLTGESIIVSIEPYKTVHEFKLLLKQTFSPASSSPNFHLFLNVSTETVVPFCFKTFTYVNLLVMVLKSKLYVFLEECKISSLFSASICLF